MIPTKKQLAAMLKRNGVLESVRIVFAKNPKDHRFDLKYPFIGTTLTLVIEFQDAPQRADWSFCKDKIVWFEVDPEERRRATIVWKTLLQPENLPRAMYADLPDGLALYQPAERKRTDYRKENHAIAL